MEQKLLTRIIELLTPLADKVKSFTLSGSYTLGFIEHINDYDVIVLCETLEDCRDCSRFARKNYSDIENNEKLSFHFILECHDIERLETSLWPYLLKNRVYYSLDGVETIKTITIDEFLDRKDNIKINYLNTIKSTEERSQNKENPESWFYDRKLWYYLYITVTILQNQSWDLTDEQKKIVNLLHDFKEETCTQRISIIDRLIKDIENL